MRRSLAQLWYQVTYLRMEDLKINLCNINLPELYLGGQ